MLKYTFVRVFIVYNTLIEKISNFVLILLSNNLLIFIQFDIITLNLGRLLMKIIHCADIHLGSKMSTHFSSVQAKERQNEILTTFGRMIDYAKDENVEAIIIAGDLLDTELGNIRACDYVLSAIRANPNIEFLYLCGNHDENSLILQTENLPSNLHTFGKNWRSYTLGDITITGVEIGKNDIYSKLKLEASNLNIVVLHGQEIKGQKQDGEVINLTALKDKNIDYLALGHIHSYKLAKLDDRGVYCYSGCLEGRGFDECGEKGFVLLDIENGKISPTFIPFASREFVELNVDISGLISIHQIKNAILEKLKGLIKNSIIKVNVIGTYTMETQKYFDLIEKDINLDFYYVQIVDKTKLFLPKKDYSQDISLAGEYVRLVQESNLDEDFKEQVLVTGLKALNGTEVD